MQTNIDITKAFMDAPDGVLSIHQISKKLSLPYGTAYNRIHSLYELGIVQILPQGKAKLCALNPDNAMTASLLALGSSQAVEEFIKNNDKAGILLKKIRKVILENARGSIYSAIILTPETVALAASPEQISTLNNENLLEGLDLTGIDLPPESLQNESTITLDFFYIKAAPAFDETVLEQAISSLMQPGYDIRITSMTVDRDTMLGMFNEDENNAGISAYSMLHNGLVLYGHENFNNLILEAFTRKLSSAQ